MAEAYLLNGGSGLRFRALTVTTPPTKVRYLPGQTLDMAGSVITADLGRSSVVLAPGSYSVSPSGALSADARYITVSATIGGVTRTAQFQVDMTYLKSHLDACSWEDIAEASAGGQASSFWPVGSVKYETIGGVRHKLVVIGYNHDLLSEDDPRYGTSYNNGSNKAGITFADYTGVYDMYHDDSDWPATSTYGPDRQEWYVNETVLPRWLASCPHDMQDANRCVKKMATHIYRVGQGTVQQETEYHDCRSFLLSVVECWGNNQNYISWGSPTEETNACSQYAYFISGGPLPHSASEPTPIRSVHDGCHANMWHIMGIATNGDIQSRENLGLTGGRGVNFHMYPVFCV